MSTRSASTSLGVALSFCLLAPFAPGQPADPVIDVNTSRWPGHQGEVSIAVDAFDPDRVLAAAMNLEEGRLITMASRDGGTSWSSTLIPLSAGTLHADPMVSFDSRGRAYLAVIPVGGGNTPLGIDVLHSDDGGTSWSSSTRISKATDRDDKLALVVDDGAGSRYRDRVHIAWKWPSGGIYYVSSHDRGANFSRPKLIDTARVSGLDLAVSAEGDLYLGASDGEKRVMRVLRSTDGGASFQPSVEVAPVRALWYTTQPSHCQRQSLVHASVAVDRSTGPHRGTVYLAWADYRAGGTSATCGDGCGPDGPCTTAIFLSHSLDSGRSWSEPVELPGQTPGSDRYFPWLRADAADGALYLAYKDTGLDPTRTATDVFLSRSTDGGLTWESPVRLSSASSDATRSRSSFQYGDYQGLAVTAGRAYAAWSDYRDPQDGEIFVGMARYAVPPLNPPPSLRARP